MMVRNDALFTLKIPLEIENLLNKGGSTMPFRLTCRLCTKSAETRLKVDNTGARLGFPDMRL